MAAIETISFQAFMSPPLHGLSWDGGLIFFGTTGVVLLGLVLLEKLGYKVNENAVRWLVRGTAFFFILWAVLTSRFLRHVLFGF